MTDTFTLLLRETYDKMFSECLKGKIPTETRLDTEALIKFLMLDNVSEIEVSIRKGCIRATHFIGSDKNISMIQELTMKTFNGKLKISRLITRIYGGR